MNTLKTERPPFDINAAINCVKEYERLKKSGVISMTAGNGILRISLDKELFVELFAGEDVYVTRRDSNFFPWGYSVERKGVIFDCIARKQLKMLGQMLMPQPKEATAKQLMDAVENFHEYSRERIFNDFNKKVEG